MTFNARKPDTIHLPPKPIPPAGSWWLEKDRAQFSAAAKQEAVRMARSGSMTPNYTYQRNREQE